MSKHTYRLTYIVIKEQIYLEFYLILFLVLKPHLRICQLNPNNTADFVLLHIGPEQELPILCSDRIVHLIAIRTTYRKAP